MRSRPPRIVAEAVFAIAATTLAACGGAGGRSAGAPSPSGSLAGPPSTTSPRVPREQPLPVESNPPGDIPDSTVFVPFRVDGGRIALRVPEGWARTASGSSVTFSDKLNSVSVSWFTVSAPPTVSAARSRDVPELQRTERAFQLVRIVGCASSCAIPYGAGSIDVRLPAGRAVVISYRSNSPPNSVTGKQYRLENLRFEFYKGGEEAVLTLSGPVGSDNVDAWRLIAESLRWT